MTKGARFPLRLVIGLAVAIALDTGLQLVWKTGIAEIPDGLSVWETVAAVALNPDSSAPKQAKVLSKPFHLRDLVTEVGKMLAA